MGRSLFIAGAIPFLILGFLHTLYTIADMVRPSKLIPRDADLLDAMKQSSLSLTGETTMWKAWVGFNLSHGLGVMFFGWIYFYLALVNFDALKDALPLFYLAPVIAALYLGLSLKYWFRIPAIGSGVGTSCFLLGVWMTG